MSVAGSTLTVTVAGQSLTATIQTGGTWTCNSDHRRRRHSRGDCFVRRSGRKHRDCDADTHRRHGAAHRDHQRRHDTIDQRSAHRCSPAPRTPRPASTVTVTVAGQTLTALVQVGGAWSATPTTVADGPHRRGLQVTDPAGNLGSATQAFTIDTSAARGHDHRWCDRCQRTIPRRRSPGPPPMCRLATTVIVTIAGQTLTPTRSRCWHMGRHRSALFDGHVPRCLCHGPGREHRQRDTVAHGRHEVPDVTITGGATALDE